MSKIVHVLGGPYLNIEGQYYNDCMILEDDGTYHEDAIYYDSEDEALDDIDLVEYGPIDLEYEWYEDEGDTHE